MKAKTVSTRPGTGYALLNATGHVGPVSGLGDRGWRCGIMIDWGRVSDLRAEIGPEDFDEVVALFLEEADEVVARMATGRCASVQHDLHFLKGSALNLGFRDLAQSCQEAERRGVSGAPVDLAGVVAVYHASRQHFAAHAAAA